jgi:small subunit ribosomal protein S6
MEQNTYELAFHLLPNIEESEVASNVEHLKGLIAQFGGTITQVVEAKKTRLSYPIRHHRYAYFGYFHFNAEPAAIAKLNAQMKLEDKVLRYLLLVLDPKEMKNVLGQKKHSHYEASNDSAHTPREEKQLDQEISTVLDKMNE